MDHIVIASNITEAQSLAGACCLALLSLLGGEKVSFPGSQAYNASMASYFSQQQAEVAPLCVVSPTSTDDVSAAIRSLTGIADAREDPSCRFAVRSGGHTSWAGANNVAGGVTLDLQGLHGVALSGDRAIASIGAGARWGAVYAELERHGVAVAGGRVAQVGVGGLTTGGGISFFSPRYGWACDTVAEFEVVLADGTVVRASDDENRDLLVALRGGSNNFGVVTRVDMRTFEQGQMWGGSSLHDLSAADDHLKGFEALVSADPYDENAALIMSFAFAAGQGSFIVNYMVHAKGEENAPVFDKLRSIPSLHSTLRFDKLSGMATELGVLSPNGMRQHWIQTSFRPTLKMLNSVYLHWKTAVGAIEEVPGVVWSLSLHPIPPSFYKNPGSTGNSLGLEDRSGVFVVAGLTVSWVGSAHDGLVEETARTMMDGIERDAREAGAYDPFVYLNYASPEQDPIGAYGPKSLEHLRKVSKRVDPNGVFTRQVPGGFKIPDAPE